MLLIIRCVCPYLSVVCLFFKVVFKIILSHFHSKNITNMLTFIKNEV